MTLPPALAPYRYQWPTEDLAADSRWRPGPGPFLVRDMPESLGELAAESRWPGFFPSAMCLVTTADGRATALEKVVGASIVNRFPYVLALSFCAADLSPRHHARQRFMETLEAGGAVVDEDQGEPLGVPVMSDRELLMDQDFSAFPADQLDEVVRLTILIARRLASKLSRLKSPSRRRGLLDLRRTVRVNLMRG